MLQLARVRTWEAERRSDRRPTGASSRIQMLQYLHQYCFFDTQYLVASARWKMPEHGVSLGHRGDSAWSSEFRERLATARHARASSSVCRVAHISLSSGAQRVSSCFSGHILSRYGMADQEGWLAHPFRASLTFQHGVKRARLSPQAWDAKRLKEISRIESYVSLQEDVMARVCGKYYPKRLTAHTAALRSETSGRVQLRSSETHHRPPRREPRVLHRLELPPARPHPRSLPELVSPFPARHVS